MDLATVDKLLTTTRTVRKRLDLTRPVDLATIQQCIELAIQAPSGGNNMRYHFMVVVDPAQRTRLATIYRKAYFDYYLPRRQAQAKADPRVYESATYLAEHLHEVPVHIIPCKEEGVEYDTTPLWQATSYGGILPATWSLMLALRARGIGAAWTTLHLLYKEEVATLLGIPPHFTQAALLPVAYFTGPDFKPAKRVPGHERTYWDTWGETRSFAGGR